MNENLQIGKASFHLPGLVGVTKDQFIASYKGVLSTDINEAWAKIQEALKANRLLPTEKEIITNEKTGKFGKKMPAAHGRKNDENPVHEHEVQTGDNPA